MPPFGAAMAPMAMADCEATLRAVRTKTFRRTAVCLLCAAAAWPQGPKQIAGVYPSLATFNEGNECGTGAVVPWAGKLWVVSYSPHEPGGSADKLYEIDAQLRQAIRPESIGGT